MIVSRRLTLLAAAQLFLAVLVASAVGGLALLQGREAQFYSAYTAKFTPVDEEHAERGPFGYTPAGFARLVRSNAQQLANYITFAVLLSIVLTAISVFQLRLARSFSLREDSSHAT